MDATNRKAARDLLTAEKGWLVERGDEIGEQARSNRDWKSQIRTIWEAARTEDEPVALLNLLRYQAARNSNWYRPQNVFEPLSEAIGECSQKAGDPGQAMDLIRHLLAYTYRAYTYHADPFHQEKQERPS